MIKLSDNQIEDFIRENKDQFEVQPSGRHFDKFLRKIKYFVSIVPYLIRVFIVTIFVFVISIAIWNTYIRKDRGEITLKQKIEKITNIFKK